MTIFPTIFGKELQRNEGTYEFHVSVVVAFEIATTERIQLRQLTDLTEVREVTELA